MESFNKCLFLISTLLVVAVSVDEAMGDAMVTGTVFCDQCLDGQRSLFDYPLSGMKVTISCSSEGQVKMMKEDTTNLLGTYQMSFEGNPDLSGCVAQLSGSGQGSSSSCGSASGPPQNLKLMFNMFGMAMYAVDSLLSQPSQPMSFCPKSPTPQPPGSTNNNVPPPPLPPVGVPPLPPSSPPTYRVPPVPFFQPSACPSERWTRPEYECYWKVVGPDTKVAVAFGLIAARKYGTDMTLMQGLYGRGSLYRTLLREATTALLNSYNSIEFRYPTLSVLGHMNLAMMGSSQDALQMALRFKRANYGYGSNLTCHFTPCKHD